MRRITLKMTYVAIENKIKHNAYILTAGLFPCHFTQIGSGTICIHYPVLYHSSLKLLESVVRCIPIMIKVEKLSTAPHNKTIKITIHARNQITHTSCFSAFGSFATHVTLLRQFRAGNEVFVGPTINPCGVAANNIPPRVALLHDTIPDADPDATTNTELAVAMKVARNCDYELKVNLTLRL